MLHMMTISVCGTQDAGLRAVALTPVGCCVPCFPAQDLHSGTEPGGSMHTWVLLLWVLCSVEVSLLTDIDHWGTVFMTGNIVSIGTTVCELPLLTVLNQWCLFPSTGSPLEWCYLCT